MMDAKDIRHSPQNSFRTIELGRRQQRRQLLLNEAKLLDDENEYDAETRRALFSLREAARYETRIRLQEMYTKLTLWQRIKAVFQGHLSF